MAHPFAVVWIDHTQAKIVHFSKDEHTQQVVHHAGGKQHLHHKAGTTGSGHAGADHAYLEEVSKTLAGVAAILVTGPASAKTELASHLKDKHKDIAKAVAAVESMDHPSDGQLLDHARKYFAKHERMVAGAGMHMPR